MTAAEKQQHYQITVDCWRLLLKYQEPVSAQEYWERLVEDARKVAERYEHLRFAEKTILAVLEEIDRIWRTKSERGEKMSDESRIPKKPQAVLSVFGGTAYECRNCGDEVQKYLPYCPWCGQMQDWSDVDEP